MLTNFRLCRVPIDSLTHWGLKSLEERVRNLRILNEVQEDATEILWRYLKIETANWQPHESSEIYYHRIRKPQFVSKCLQPHQRTVKG